MAEHLGMSLRQCMAVHTEREMLVTLAYIGLRDRDPPTRLEYYLAALRAEVRQLRYQRAPGPLKLEHYLLRFDRPEPVPREAGVVLAHSKAAWGVPVAKLAQGSQAGVNRGGHGT